MEQTLITKSVLHQLGIGKSYKGYDYILYSLELITHDANCLTCITKTLYIDVAQKFQTSSTCVERNIRKVIEVIWKHIDDNQCYIKQIFGTRHLKTKPSNKEFLELLYEYVKSDDLFHAMYHIEKIICPIAQKQCTAYKEIIEKYIK